MSRWDFRTNRISRRSLRSMIHRAGKARLPEPNPQAFEQLEGRVLLAGDEPGFNQVFNTPSPLFPPQIPIDGVTGVGTGEVGSGSSIISPAGEDDVFRFVAPANDFVRIWADTRSTNSTLDSRVEVYTGIIGGSATLVASGSNNGTLSGGVFNDGWVGFKAVAGTEYFVVVRSDALSGPGSAGDYTLRINAISTAFPALDSQTGEGSVTGSITRAGSDVVYRITTPAGSDFNGLMTIVAQADPTDLDPRIELYDADGALIKFDSDAGNLTDAFLGAVSRANTVYYLRVRSDEFGDPLLRPSTGAYTIKIDAIPDAISLDPVTRLSETVSNFLPSQQDTQLYSFVAQGTGLSFISLGVGFPPIPDSGLRIFNDQGTQIGFNELPGALSRLIIQLEGGRRYFVVVDAFDALGGGAYTLQIEAHHTFLPGNSEPVDDHVNTPTGGGDAARRQFELATPIIWGGPVAAPIPVPGLLPPLPDPGADHVQVLLGQAMGRVHAAGDTDLFQFVPPVDMLGEFEGREVPNAMVPAWLTRFRPASKLQIIAQGTDPFLNAPAIRVLDSNFNVIYANNGQVITQSGRYGALSPSSVPPALPIMVYGYTFGAGQPANIEVWGGEVYYLEVSSGTTGRYSLTVQVDAPTDTISNFGPSLPTAGNFAQAWEIRIDANSGEGRNYNNVAGGQLVPLPGGQFTLATGNGTPIMNGRGFAMNIPAPVPPPAGTGATVNNVLGTPGSRGQLLLRMSDFGVITSPTDTHLYQFRALYTGTAEVRINTTNIADEWFEAGVRTYEDQAPYNPISPPDPPVQEVFGPKTKTLNSPLDSALRIFDNDQTEIAYNNDNGVTGGESDTINVGAWAGRTFWRRDARAVFPVVAGNIYYIQVESGQRSNFSLTFPKVDWRRATGGYELLVNTMSDLAFDDDHVNFNNAVQATPIPVNLNTTSTTAILGSVDGEIVNTLFNPNDTDMFFFLSPGNGTLRFTLSTRAGDSFARTLSVYDNNGVLVGQTNGTGTNDISISVPAVQGDRYYAVVDGDEGAGQAEGRYTIKVSGVPFVDDHASESNFQNATHIDKDLYDYDGTETLDGAIETTGDTDIFSFDSLTFDLATITVVGNIGFRPAIRVYEISVDPAGNPIRLQIANNIPTPGNQTATVTFSVSAPPRSTGGNAYPTYYAVVSGANPNIDRGTYTFTLSVTKTTDDHPDGPNPPPPGVPFKPGQYDVATPIAIDPAGNGTITGVIELAGDTDLFTFVTPWQGQIVVSVTVDTSSLLLPRVRIIDEFFNAVTDVTSSQVFVTGPDAPVSVATFTWTGTRNARFYVMVEGAPSVGNVHKTEVTGAYSVSTNVPVPDDHPNIGEFNLATVIPLSTFSGGGSATGVISPALDTDLFQFTALVNGSMVVTISTPGSNIRPVLRFFAPDQSQVGAAIVDGGPGDEDGILNGTVAKTFSVLAGSTYWVLVNSDPSGVSTTGSYIVSLNGPPLQGPDDHANRGDFANATQIILNQSTGDGTATGLIEIAGDTDLFYFISLTGSTGRPLPAFVQIVTPQGQLLNLGVRIIRQDQVTVLAQDSQGGPGYNAGVQFGVSATAERYYIEVEGLDTLTGSYTVRVDTSPEIFSLYFPGSVSNTNIREYFSIGNSNSYTVNYTVILRYLDDTIPDVRIDGSVEAGKRGGVTISDGDPSTPDLATPGKRYAIIIESDGFLAANLSHYETNASGGEAFTRFTSTSWSFAKGEKLVGAVNDLVDYYNPNPTAARVTLTAYKPDGTSFSVIQIVQGFKAGQFDILNSSALPVGRFAFTVTSEAVNPGDAHVGIVAGLSHYDLSLSNGYYVMGTPGGGSRAGVIPGLIDSGNLTPSQKSEITLFNASSSPATITLVGKYLTSGIPDLVRPISLAPFESITLTGTQLGMVANQPIGLRYDSSTPVTVLASTVRFGEADAAQAETEVGNRWYFGDAFINRLRAGQLYFESMYFYNPNVVASTIQLRFVFNFGAEASHTLTVPARNFARVNLHTLPAVLNHAVFNYFSIEAFSTNAFSVTMSHYDLFIGGGWITGGAPLGLTNPIASLA